MEAAVERSRAAILRGDVYCSSRCGFNCKRAAYDRAVIEADALATCLGEGWRPEVWENCGWCYAAHKGVMHVHPKRQGSSIAGAWEVSGYTCYFNSAKQVVTDAILPEDAVGFAVQDARTLIERLREDLAAIAQ